MHILSILRHPFALTVLQEKFQWSKLIYNAKVNSNQLPVFGNRLLVFSLIAVQNLKVENIPLLAL